MTLSAATKNEMLLAMMDTLIGAHTDLEPARVAFERARGDFSVRFVAAVEALVARLVIPEVFIDIPEDPESMSKADLEALVRPAAAGFLRSHPTKSELIEQLALIKRRQERRPAWMPRVSRDGTPMAGAAELTKEADYEAPARTLVVTGFPELGDVEVELPAGIDGRPELTMAPGGVGELEVVLHAVLALTSGQGSSGVVRLDTSANEALVADGNRWWAIDDMARRLTAAEDPGVASELLATTATVGGVPVSESTPDADHAVATALAGAADWRYSPRWLLDGWDPGSDARALATARATVAAWADDDEDGIVIYVYGGTLHAHDGVLAAPHPFHSYLLSVTRSSGTDAVGAVQRLTLSCPGDDWCHRGGCPAADTFAAGELLVPIMAGAAAAEAAEYEEWAGQVYNQLYGANLPDFEDTVPDCAEAVLAGLGWTLLNRTEWEGGMEELLLRRGNQLLSAAYDPLSRQLTLSDGRRELDLLLQIMADEGVITGEDGDGVVDRSEEAATGWSAEALAAAEDSLRGAIPEPTDMASAQITILGVYPSAVGVLQGPGSSALLERQLTALLNQVGFSNDSVS